MPARTRTRKKGGAGKDATASTVRLEEPSSRWRDAFLAAARRSRRLHGRWIAAPGDRTQFDAWIERVRLPTQLGYLVVAPSGDLAGVVNVSEIVRGNFQSAYLGYYAFSPHERRGHMTEGLRLVIEDAFGVQDLHRLEANVQPGNEASRRLVRGLGFRLEGLSPRYLKIAGRWRDHERWAITREDWVRVSRSRTRSRRTR